MEIRKMLLSDLDKVVELDNICFLSPWGESQFKYELEENPFATVLVAVDDNKIIGMIDYWITFEVGQINQIAVLPEFRKKGIASALLITAFKNMAEHEVFNCTLEVRVHNESAIKFYLKHGFEITCTLSIFVPKPFTPFQWCGQMDLDEVTAHIMYLKEKTCVKKGYYDNGDDAYYMERRMFDVYNNFSN